MRQNQSKELLNLLKNKGIGIYVPSHEIMAALQISKRQVQKYISSLNETSLSYSIILSNRNGYALNPKAIQKVERLLENNDNIETPESRRNYILQKVISAPGQYDVLDLAEELFVSEATIESDIQKARQYVNAYHLIIEKKYSKLYIKGNEKDKRAFMQAHLFRKGYEKFSLKEIAQFLTFNYNLLELYNQMRSIFLKYEVFVNDYALHNVVIHIIIMIERISKNFELDEEIDFSEIKTERQFFAAKELVHYLQNQYHITITEVELYNLVLLISNNSSLTNYAVINAQNIEKYIDSKYIEIARDLFQKVANTYHLDPFNEEFIATFTIHIKNLFHRIKNKTTIKNPLTKSFKSNYPLIYDIAVFIAQVLRNDYKIMIDEDEIAFIAFHVGSFFEISASTNKKVNCLFAYTDYYGFYQNQVKRIMDIFKEDMNIVAALPASVCTDSIPKVDLIISTTDIKSTTQTMIIHPLMTNQDIDKIRSIIKEITLTKRNKALKTCLSQLFHEDIFYKDIPYQDAEQTIINLTQDVISKNYAVDKFTQDVLAREHLSPTAFNEIAVPHSLTDSAMESFIAFATCNQPILWGDKHVSIVVLIGVTEESRNIFAEVFDSLVDVLSNPLNIIKLTKATCYQEFMNDLLDAMPS